MAATEKSRPVPKSSGFERMTTKCFATAPQEVCPPGIPEGPGIVKGPPERSRRPRSPPRLRPPRARVLHSPRSQGHAPRTDPDGADMGRAMVARLGLGLLLLALLLPTQIYSNQTTIVTLSSNSSQSTSTAPNPANTTTTPTGGALLSTASLFVISFSLLHLYC
ncbi:signal transducer CD24 isoform X1 [Canis lupus familiaris]|nr:signal transducer CD24 isoform X1 [Canis lupus familiaris]